ncbi:hypothetical protein GCM10027605_20500 [Micromonospora zhanjiangensis]
MSTDDRTSRQKQPHPSAAAEAGATAARRRGATRTRNAPPAVRSVTPVVSTFPDLVTADLTARQRRILEFIRDWVERYGYPPSVREIGEAVGLVSPSSVAYQLKELERKGFLRRDPNRPRAVDVRPPSDLVDDEAARAQRPTPAYVPMLGRIAAGGPILAEQAVEDVFPSPASWWARARCSCSRSRATRCSTRRSVTVTGWWSGSSRPPTPARSSRPCSTARRP